MGKHKVTNCELELKELRAGFNRTQLCQSTRQSFGAYYEVNMSVECVLVREFGLGENKTQMKYLLLHLNANLQYHK